jgi:putative resolvase
MKLSEWARRNGVSYRTAWNWFRAGTLPVPATQLPTGTILVDTPDRGAQQAALYARVSSADHKVIAEVGSGLNGDRPKLIAALRDPKIHVLVVEHRDRLARFGSEYIEAAIAAQGRQILVVDDTEMKDDLVQDMIDVLTSFCARLYGRRSARHRAERAVRCAAGGEEA